MIIINKMYISKRRFTLCKLLGSNQSLQDREVNKLFIEKIIPFLNSLNPNSNSIPDNYYVKFSPKTKDIRLASKNLDFGDLFSIRDRNNYLPHVYERIKYEVLFKKEYICNIIEIVKILCENISSYHCKDEQYILYLEHIILTKEYPDNLDDVKIYRCLFNEVYPDNNDIINMINSTLLPFMKKINYNCKSLLENDLIDIDSSGFVFNKLSTLKKHQNIIDTLLDQTCEDPIYFYENKLYNDKIILNIDDEDNDDLYCLISENLGDYDYDFPRNTLFILYKRTYFKYDKYIDINSFIESNPFANIQLNSQDIN